MAHLIVMGVAGSGKSTIGRRTAALLGWPYFDGDDYHGAANVAKMAAGIALTDEDRWPWLDRMNAAMAGQPHSVAAASCLRQAYRERIACGLDVRFAFANGEKALVAARLAARPGHFFDPRLNDSQFSILEPPKDALALDIRAPVEELARACADWMRSVA
jgi:carbohydrate kinase (thermoresistant glucokinase family)